MAVGPFEEPVDFVSVKPTVDNADADRVTVVFVVKANTMHAAMMAAKSEEVIQRGIREARQKGLGTSTGISGVGVAMPCDKDGKLFENHAPPETEDPHAVFYATITHVFMGGD